jgi:RNA polymerase sigma-70 factor (ECF subfamily)
MEASRAASARRQNGSLARLTPLRRKRVAAAFDELYREHARDVYQYALALLTNPADAEDAAQTTFLNAYRALERGERPRRPHNWLIAITHNVCRMRWRQAQSRPSEVALEDAPEPAAIEHERTDLDQVLHALARLSFNQRAALVMRELEGRSYREIAEVLGLSVSAVEALLFRARQQLRLERRALGALTTVPLPGALSSLVGGGGGAIAVGGAAVGGNVVLKAAAVVAAGALTAGAGYESVHVISGPSRIAAPASAQRAVQAHPDAAVAAARAARAAQTSHNHPTRRRTGQHPGGAQVQPQPAAPSQTTAPTQQRSAPQASTPSTQPVVSNVVSTVASTAAAATRALPPPPAPPPPVSLPAPPPPPPLPVTVTTPTLPLPPLKLP